MIVCTKSSSRTAPSPRGTSRRRPPPRPRRERLRSSTSRRRRPPVPRRRPEPGMIGRLPGTATSAANCRDADARRERRRQRGGQDDELDLGDDARSPRPRGRRAGPGAAATAPPRRRPRRRPRRPLRRWRPWRPPRRGRRRRDRHDDGSGHRRRAVLGQPLVRFFLDGAAIGRDGRGPRRHTRLGWRRVPPPVRGGSGDARASSGSRRGPSGSAPRSARPSSEKARARSWAPRRAPATAIAKAPATGRRSRVWRRRRRPDVGEVVGRRRGPERRPR